MCPWIFMWMCNYYIRGKFKCSSWWWMIFYILPVCSWYFSCMKPALHGQTLVTVPASLPAGVTGMHKFSANSWCSTIASKIAYTCYNLENEALAQKFFPKQCCLIISRVETYMIQLSNMHHQLHSLGRLRRIDAITHRLYSFKNCMIYAGC